MKTVDKTVDLSHCYIRPPIDDYKVEVTQLDYKCKLTKGIWYIVQLPNNKSITSILKNKRRRLHNLRKRMSLREYRDFLYTSSMWYCDDKDAIVIAKEIEKRLNSSDSYQWNPPIDVKQAYQGSMYPEILQI